jgi:putative acetyltransferase
MSLTIRLIEERDNFALAAVIRKVLEEQGNNVDGTVYTDSATDAMFNSYQTLKSAYYVVFIDDVLVGGCGIAPLTNTDIETCELQRLFLLKKARGLGFGQKLMELCLTFAKKSNFKRVYLETFPNMIEALGLYKKNGFELIKEPLGNTGHFYCTTRMLLNLV